MNERHVALEGCLNLRDIGGYVTHDRREVRWGCLYRSGELCSLTDADLQTMDRLGVRVVIDLRNEWERSARPDRLPSEVQLIERRSRSATGGPGRTLEEQIATGEFPVKDDERFTRMYVDALDRMIPEIRLIFELAVDAPGRPMLFHCAAGKDRTGIATAVLLGVLGVPVQTIIEDYELTTTYYATRRLNAVASLLAEHGVPPDSVSHLVEARTPALEGCLEYLHDRWGSFVGYATTAVGVPADLPDRLRASLTTAIA